MTSQRSTFIIRPSSETITLRNRSRLMVVGSVNARRLMMPSRASCILILRSSERDFAVSDMGYSSSEIIANRAGTCKEGFKFQVLYFDLGTLILVLCTWLVDL